VIWNVLGLPSQDIEGSNDLYVRAIFNKSSQQTDIHYRSINGEGNFNWRILWREHLPLSLSSEEQYINIQVWDKDFGKSDDFIGEHKLDIFKNLKRIEATENLEKFNNGDIFELELRVIYIKIKNPNHKF
jgi:hypothetical protein